MLKNRIHGFLFPVVVFLVGLGMFVPTLYPGIAWFNSGEFASAAISLDVPHAPGYPLFTRLANLATFLPFEREPAWKVNLLAAFFGALTGGLFCAWLLATGVSGGLSFWGGIWLMSFTTFWEEATLGEVYTMETVFLCLGLLLVRSLQGENDGSLTGNCAFIGSGKGFLLGFLAALAITHRISFVLFLPGFAFLLKNSDFIKRVSFRTLIGIGLGLIAGSLPLLDLYFRLQSPDRVIIDPLVGKDLPGFWNFITGADYRKALGVFSIPELLSRLKHWCFLMVQDGGFFLAVFPLLAFWKHRFFSLPHVGAVTWILFINSGFILNYNAFEAHTMLLPSMLAICAIVVNFLNQFHNRKRLIAAGFALMVLTNLGISFQRLAPRNREVESFAQRLTALVPPGSVLLMSSDVEFRPVWYLRLAKKFRPDLNFRLIDFLDEQGLIEIASDSEKRGVFGSMIFPPDLKEKLSRKMKVVPWGYLSRIQNTRSGALPEPSEMPVELRFPETGNLRLASQAGLIPMPDWSGKIPERIEGVARPGDVLSYSFQAASGTPRENFFLFAVLVDDNGKLPSSNGLLLGFDFCRLNGVNPEKMFRTLIIPENISPGIYELKILLGKFRKGSQKNSPQAPAGEVEVGNFFADGVSGVNLLNADGFSEVFRLKNGIVVQPMIKEVDWAGLMNSGITWVNASNPVVLGKLSIEPPGG